MGDVGVDGVVGVVTALVAADDQLAEVFGEQIAHDADGEIRLAVQLLRRLAALDQLLDGFPLRLQPVDVAHQFFLGGAFGGGTDDEAGVLLDEPTEDVLESSPLVLGQLARDAGQVTAGRVDDVAARNRDVVGQPRSLGADRILGDLDQDRLPGLEHLLHLAGFAVHAEGIPIDLTGVQHGVSAAADVDERGLHGGQHVLHAPQVDVADQRGGRIAIHVVLDQ